MEAVMSIGKLWRKLLDSRDEAQEQVRKLTGKVEFYTAMDDDDAADKAQDQADEWETWLSELEGQLEAILTDTQDVLSRRPKAA